MSTSRGCAPSSATTAAARASSRRAIDNLLDNAAKYSEPGTAVRLVVDEAAGPDGPRARFAVVDRGIGMSAEELERAGTPFWRADGSRTRRTGGVGLGLALARRIARAHGGDVTLQSAPGQGTTARIDVPAAASSREHHPEQTVTRGPTPALPGE